MRKTTTVLKYILTLIGLITFYNISMYLVCKIPSDMLYNNVLESAKILKEQGTYYSQAFFSFVENSVDALIINEAYSVDSNDPVRSYILVRKNYKDGLTRTQLEDQKGQLFTYGDNNYSGDIAKPDNDFDAQKELLNFLSNKVEISREYARYYHGYLVLYRPLLILFTISGIRIIMTALLLTLLLIMTNLLYKKFGVRIAMIYAGNIIIYGFFSVAQTIEEAPLYFIMLLSTTIMLFNIEKFNKERMMYLLFVVGSFVAFVDFLTTPALTLFLPLSILYIYNNKNNNKLCLSHEKIKNVLIDVFLFGLVWVLGYGTTLFSKFVVADVLCGTSVIKSGIEQILFRINGEVNVFNAKYVMYLVIHAVRTGGVAIVFSIIALFLIDKLKFKKNIKETIGQNSNLLILSLVPVCWMMLLLNHTLYHFDLYPYRNLMSVIIVLILIITDDKEGINKDERVSKKNN